MGSRYKHQRLPDEPSLSADNPTFDLPIDLRRPHFTGVLCCDLQSRYSLTKGSNRFRFGVVDPSTNLSVQNGVAHLCIDRGTIAEHQPSSFDFDGHLDVQDVCSGPGSSSRDGFYSCHITTSTRLLRKNYDATTACRVPGRVQ